MKWMDSNVEQTLNVIDYTKLKNHVKLVFKNVYLMVKYKKKQSTHFHKCQDIGSSGSKKRIVIRVTAGVLGMFFF